jgi:hypothetical protein
MRPFPDGMAPPIVVPSYFDARREDRRWLCGLLPGAPALALGKTESEERRGEKRDRG